MMRYICRSCVLLCFNFERVFAETQGKFPVENAQEDGWVGTSPVDAFSPNPFGLHIVSSSFNGLAVNLGNFIYTHTVESG
jgi:hypothetical protein